MSASETYDERLRRLRERADAPKPESIVLDDQHPEVVGVFLGFEQGHTSYGECVIARLEVDGVERSLWCFHSVLMRELVRSRVTPGEMILIRRGGKRRREGGGDPYYEYTVKVDRPDGGGGLTLEQAARLAHVEDELEPRTAPAPRPASEYLPADADIQLDDDLPF